MKNIKVEFVFDERSLESVEKLRAAGYEVIELPERVKGWKPLPKCTCMLGLLPCRVHGWDMVLVQPKPSD